MWWIVLQEHGTVRRAHKPKREKERRERERERCSRRNCIVYSAWVKCQIGKCQKMMEGSCLWACLLPAVCAKVAHRLGCTLLIRNSNQATGLNSRRASGIHLLASDFHFTGKSRKQTDKCDSSSHNSQISTKLAKDKSNCTYYKHRIGYSNNNNQPIPFGNRNVETKQKAFRDVTNRFHLFRNDTSLVIDMVITRLGDCTWEFAQRGNKNKKIWIHFWSNKTHVTLASLHSSFFK